MTARALYIDPFGGAAGDMLLAALIDLGAPVAEVEAAVHAAGVPGVRLQTRLERRHGIAGQRAVFVDADGRPIDPLEREPEQTGGGHPHTPWPDIRARLDAACLAARPKALALRIFTRLAEAEAQVHRVDAEQISLHELGGLDTIADIVGVAAALSCLAPARVVCGPLPFAGGQVQAAHGVLPAPAPATAWLCQGAAVTGIDAPGEHTTPTGAAILVTVADSFGPIPAGVLRRVGVGLGHRDPPHRANLLRAFLVELPGAQPEDAPTALYELAANLDDEHGEVCAHAASRLLEVGAVDAWITPVIMKKGRPGVVLHALVPEAGLAAATQVILSETSSLGVRAHPVQRQTLERRLVEVRTPFGPVPVKQALLDGRPIKGKPEHDACSRLARDHGVTLREVVAAARAALDRGELA